VLRIETLYLINACASIFCQVVDVHFAAAERDARLTFHET
jgi:hypothetical protein